jgi:hypothetical protein
MPSDIRTAIYVSIFLNFLRKIWARFTESRKARKRSLNVYLRRCYNDPVFFYDQIFEQINGFKPVGRTSDDKITMGDGREIRVYRDNAIRNPEARYF